MEIPTGLSYADALLVPQRSPVESRADVDLSTRIAPSLDLGIPICSAPMDTVTEAETARALADEGGLGVVHRFLPIEEQADEVRSVGVGDRQVAAAVGIAREPVERAEALVDAGADALVVDVAHGHLESCLDAAERLASAFPETPLVAGNVATPTGVRDLAAAGVDCVRVGVGPGSHCTTRQVTGVGVPQLTAVHDCARAARSRDVRVIADGGIRNPGDAVKALMAGADAVMIGGLLAGTDEAPGEIVEFEDGAYKRSRGMASAEAREARPGGDDGGIVEGVAGYTPYRGPLSAVVEDLTDGIRSGLSYCGGHTIAEARENAEFVRATPGAKEREGADRNLLRRVGDGD